ncbi:MAG: hybrid sensor histidine kinase/response regulator, partial [Verrucomicrobia bacterium]|nr:hybrid sensor histidine kinase/response regulator [Verrucomicrobiota bacterium]
QRMESIGILAGGIAHDLNNALAPILMGLSMLQAKSNDAEVRRLMSVMEKSAQHGASLVRQVLAFARGTQGERAELQPQAVIREAVTLLSETLPRAITVEMDAAPDLALVSADSTQLSQVLMNLGINARDAMPEGGRLVFRALNVTVGEGHARVHPGISAGPYVLLVVEDSGTGIPPDIIERIFDPFFTTKGAGKGSGLGLSTVLGIVKSHGGFMEVQSEIGHGTKFSLYFPAITASQVTRPTIMEKAPPRGNGETILVIDDEADVRDVVQALLESSGYTVRLAAEGMAGIGVYSEYRSEISAVITDMMMPAMQGSEVVKELRKINPELRVVAMSGVLASNTNIREEPGRTVLLQKPMTGIALLQTVHKLLQAK